ncbi:MAG: hypothetical protein ACRDS1_07910, partial [Pseudonocardiaceae bacterium]
MWRARPAGNTTAARSSGRPDVGDATVTVRDRSLRSRGHRSDLTPLLTALGVEIDPKLLTLALTHRSYAYESGGLEPNERLEFLG